jgi:lipoate-protein ligase A
MMSPPDITPYTADEPLLEGTRADGQPRLAVYRPQATVVVLGRGSKPELELELQACVQDRVPLQRRRGGGCAVVLDPGNVIVSLTLAEPGYGDNTRHFRRISAWICGALARLGQPGVRQEGASDLALGPRKVGGACIYRARGLLHYGTTLLAEPDVPLMERYLRHPPREPAYRRGRPHAQFVGSLGGSAAELEQGLRQELRLLDLQRQEEP